MNELTHLSLFSGIGGLDLAAEWAGIRTIGQCEWADYPTKVLEKHWPDVPRWRDIRTLTKESFYERTGKRTVDIISGGFPCQPFSVAGKQRGKEDDRYLWPEMVRVIQELRPTWIVGENVAGIVRMALPDILSELEACGYRTRTFLIPACAVGARHRRYRVAIVGYAEHNGLSSSEVTGSTEEAGGRQQERAKTAGELTGTSEPGNREIMADPKGVRQQRLWPEKEQVSKARHEARKSERRGYVCNPPSERLSDRSGEPVGGQGTPEPEFERPDSDVSNANNRSWDVRRNGELPTAQKAGRARKDYRAGEKEYEPGKRRPVKSILGGMADGIPAGMDRDFLINHYWDIEPDIPRIATGIEHRVDRLKCLGNAVVPQQFYPVFDAIKEVESRI